MRPHTHIHFHSQGRNKAGQQWRQWCSFQIPSSEQMLLGVLLPGLNSTFHQELPPATRKCPSPQPKVTLHPQHSLPPVTGCCRDTALQSSPALHLPEGGLKPLLQPHCCSVSPLANPAFLTSFQVPPCRISPTTLLCTQPSESV